MRKIGSLPDQGQAERFSDYLLTQGITAVVESDAPEETGGGPVQHHLWIREEDQLDTACRELQAFIQQPQAPQYQAREQAAKIRSQRILEAKRRLRLQRKVTPASGGGFPGSAMSLQSRPIYFTIAVIVISVAASLITQFGEVRAEAAMPGGGKSAGELVWRSLTFVNFNDFLATGDPLASIKQGELWRLVTPMFLHGDMMHLLFNMLGMFFLGGVVERIHGIGFMATMTLLCQLVSCLAQGIMPTDYGGTPLAIGASGAIVGLFGYLWIRPLLEPGYPVQIPPFFIAMTLVWLAMGVVGVVPNIANVAHASGLMTGMLLAPISLRVRKT